MSLLPSSFLQVNPDSLQASEGLIQGKLEKPYVAASDQRQKFSKCHDNVEGFPEFIRLPDPT